MAASSIVAGIASGTLLLLQRVGLTAESVATLHDGDSAQFLANMRAIVHECAPDEEPAFTRPLPLPLLPARADQWKKRRVETAVTSTSFLRDAEAALRDKWLLRLRAVRHRAGTAASAATLLDNVDSQFEPAELEMLSLGKGAWSTLRGHVRRWEAFERWAQPACVYPPTVETILRYYGHKDASSCGPCVLPAFRGTLLWMCRRLCMTPPALESPVFGAVEARVIERRGKEVAEAVPIPILAVRSLERSVVEWRAAGHAIACIVAWQMLLATWASLRFDDCLHVDPASLRLSESALYFTAQKTKRDQGRRGTKYVVCNASLTQAEWLREGYECLVANAPDTYFRGDFFLFDSDGWRARWQAPLAYQDFVANLRGVVVRSVAEATEPAIVENREAILRDARRLTGHSPRPTIPTAMALGGSDSLPIQLQGKWKSQGMVQKYIRDRGGVVLSSVRQIAAGLRDAWEKEEVLTQTESQEPADREKEEGSASDGQAEDDEETEDNVYWATSKAWPVLNYRHPGSLRPQCSKSNLCRQCFNGRLVVAPVLDSVVPEFEEPRCSLCDSGKLRSFSRNQHSPRHLVSPFPDDQHKTHTILGFLLSKKPQSIDTCGTPSKSS